MKKTNFAILILLAVCVTVAGAYATWNYTNGQDVTAAANQSISVNLAEKVVETAKGTLTADVGTTAITGEIDNGGNYKAVLNLTGDDIKVTFNPSEDSTAQTVVMYATITLKTVTKYNGEEILSVKTERINSGSAVSVWNISAADIAGCLTLADITLDTEAKYDALKKAMSTADGDNGIATVIEIAISAE